MFVRALIALAVCACAPRPIDRPTTIVHCAPCAERSIEYPEAEEPTAQTEVDIDRAPDEWLLATLREDVDGDGSPELIELFSDGSVHVGQAVGGIRLGARPSRADEPWPGGLEVVDVRRGDAHREVLVWERFGDEEGPPSMYVVLSARGESLYVSEPISIPNDATTPNGERMRPIIAGDGVLRGRFESCDGSHVVRTDIEHRLTREGSFRAIHEHVDHTDRTCVLAACPYVYVGGRYVGEILRNLVGASAETEQTLELPNAIAEDGTLTVTLRELKPEITYLDELHVVADGRVIAPRACELACDDDGEYVVLSTGDERTYVFDVGAASHITLVARGYYDPL